MKSLLLRSSSLVCVFALSLLTAHHVMAASLDTILSDMPTPESVLQKIKGRNAEQTLGRQCQAVTALASLIQSSPLLSYNESNSAPAIKLREIYSNTRTTLMQQYDHEVKSLAVEKNKKEWFRWCEGMDENLKQASTALQKDEILALLGPVARKTYEERSLAEQQARATQPVAYEKQDSISNNFRKKHFQGLLALGILALLIWVARLASNGRTQYDANQYLLNGKKYNLHQYTGTVEEAQKRDVLEIKSSGGGGHLHNGTGYVAPPQITSTTHTYDDIYLKAKDGSEHLVQLLNWNVASKQGNVLQALWLIPAGSKHATDYTLIHNHNTGKSYWQDSLLSSIHGLSEISKAVWILGIPFITAVFWVMYGEVIGVLTGIGGIIWYIKIYTTTRQAVNKTKAHLSSLLTP